VSVGEQIQVVLAVLNGELSLAGAAPSAAPYLAAGHCD
jgi:hypothetical protein